MVPCITSYPRALTCGSNSWLAQRGAYYGIKTPPIDPSAPTNLLKDDPTCGPLLRASLTSYGQKQAASSEEVFNRSTDAFAASVPSAVWLPAKRVGT